MRTTLFLAAAYAASGLIPTSRAAEPTLAEIIEAVRENELLYQNIDVTVTFTYRTYNRPQRASKPREQGGMKVFEILSQDQRHRFVNQGECFRLDKSTYQTYDGRDASTVVELEAFDGTTHRALLDTTGNLALGRREPTSPLFPHILLLGIKYPLSVHLGGEAAMRVHPAAQRHAAMIELKLVGVDHVEGLRCYKLEHVRIKPGAGPSAKTELWLAEERNFIPAKVQIYGLWHSHTEPGTVAQVLEWQEIAPGIWFPSHTLSKHYYIFLPHEPGNPLLNWTQEHRLESVSLDPSHHISYFRPEFPEGTAVYEVENGEIAKSYRAGTPGASSAGGTGGGTRPTWALWAGLAFTVGMVGVIVCLRYRRGGRKLPESGGVVP